MRCSLCNEENAPGAVNCARCGASLSASQAPRPAASGPRTCPQGLHLMGAGWTECKYCRADQDHADNAGGRKPTVAESPAPPGVRRVTVVEHGHPATPPPPFPSANPAPGTPLTPAIAEKSGERKTAFYSSLDQPSIARGVVPSRRIVGMLITYTWRPEGQVFPICEGRNLIGRDPSQCDVAVPEDVTLSSINSHITFRKSFVLGDSISMGGTDLNDDPVEEQFRPLPNYSRIRTGSTHWIFIMVTPQNAH